MLQVKYLIHGKDNKFAVSKKKLAGFPARNVPLSKWISTKITSEATGGVL